MVDCTLLAALGAIVAMMVSAVYTVWTWVQNVLKPVPSPEPSVASINGILKYSDASKVGGATVMLLQDGMLLFCVQSCADGSFVFDDVSAGTYLVAAYKDLDDYYWLEDAKDVTINSDNSSVELTLSLMPEE